MGLMDAIRTLFTSRRLPDETREMIDEEDTPENILAKLDTLVTENEIKAKEIQREIDNLEKIELHHRDRIKSGELNDREKRGLAMEIQRLRKKMDNYEARHRIYDENIHLHMNLMASIQDIMARQLAGVSEDVIDSIALKAQESIEEHDRVVTAGQVPSGQEREVQKILDEIEEERVREEAEAERDAEVLEKALEEEARREEAEEAEEAEEEAPELDEEIEEAIEEKVQKVEEEAVASVKGAREAEEEDEVRRAPLEEVLDGEADEDEEPGAEETEAERELEFE